MLQAALALGVFPLAAVSALRAAGLRLDGIHSSTGAWISAYAHQVLLVGDYAAVSNLSHEPSTTTNLIYPWLLTSLARLQGVLADPDPELMGHLLAAGSLGLIARLLGAMWYAGRGWQAALLGSAAVMWPPLVATATWIRPDTLAIALGLATVLLAARIIAGPSTRPWLFVGLGLGLCYGTREYLVVPIASAIATAWVLDLYGRSDRWRGGALRATAVVVGLIPAALIPCCLGFWPHNGIASMVSYGGGRTSAIFTTADLLCLPWLAPVWLAGLAGLAVAAIRGHGTARSVPLVLIGAILPFGGFLLSNQQSPQYYVFAQVILIAGLAGWLDFVPRGLPRSLLAPLVVALGLCWAGPRVHPITEGDAGARPPHFHSEAWPASRLELLTLVDWSLCWAPGSPLVVVSTHIENFDKLYTIRYHRPVAVLFEQHWSTELPDLVRFYEGQDVYVLLVDRADGTMPLPEEATVLGQLQLPRVVGTMMMYSGERPPPQSRTRTYPCVDWKGACQQADWLSGGLERLRARAYQPGPAFAGGNAPGLIPEGFPFGSR